MPLSFAEVDPKTLGITPPDTPDGGEHYCPLQESPSVRHHLLRNTKSGDHAWPSPPALVREASASSVRSYGSVELDALGKKWDLERVGSDIPLPDSPYHLEDDSELPRPSNLLWLAIALMMGVSMNFCSITNSYFLKSLGGSPAQVTAALATVSLPWSVKPIWGFLVDNMRSTVGFHGYAALGTVATAAGWFLTARAHEVGYYVDVNLVAQGGLSLLSVVGETMMVVACGGLSQGEANATQARCRPLRSIRRQLLRSHGGSAELPRTPTHTR